MKKTKKSFSSFLNNSIDYTLLITVFLLLSLGLIMVLSASSPTALSEGSNSYAYFIRQLIFAVLGLFAMFAISKIDYRFYKRVYKLGYLIAIALLLAVLVIGRTVNGAKRWIVLSGALSFQPSEIVKLLMIIFYAAVLTKNRDQLGKFFKGIVKHAIYLIPIALLLMLEPHLSATLVIGGVCILMMVFAGCKLWKMIVPGLCVGIPGLIYIIITSSYRLKRVTTFLNPWSDQLGEGWQVIQSLYAIGSGGLFGLGLGQSKQKYLYFQF